MITVIKVDLVSEISNIISVQSDSEVQFKSQSTIEDNYIPIKAEKMILVCFQTQILMMKNHSKAANRSRMYYYGRNADWFGNKPFPKIFEIAIPRNIIIWVSLDLFTVKDE